MRVALAGSGRLAANLLRGLEAHGHELVALIADGRQTRGRARTRARWAARLLGGGVMGLAARRGLPIVYIDKMTAEELAPLRASAPDLILVGGFGIILKPPVIELPRLGCINSHSSLLPRHRGPNPFSAAILSGDTETGVTFHVIDPGIDTGDILAQERIPLTSKDTLLTVYKRTSQKAGEMIGPLLDHIEAEGVHGTPQDTALATYEKRPTAADAWLDWGAPAEVLDRKVRALSPSPLPRFTRNGHAVFVLRAKADPEPVEAAPGTVVAARPQLRIATGAGTLTIFAAFTLAPVPGLWPGFFVRFQPGDRLE